MLHATITPSKGVIIMPVSGYVKVLMAVKWINLPQHGVPLTRKTADFSDK